MPPALAAKVTVSELAVLRILGDEVRARGARDRTIAEIAARAGCLRTTVQGALRLAAALGLITIQERRRQGQKNLANLVRVLSREWLAWLVRGPRPTGFGNSDPTDIQDKEEVRRALSGAKGFQGREPYFLRRGAPGAIGRANRRW